VLFPTTVRDPFLAGDNLSVVVVVAKATAVTAILYHPLPTFVTVPVAPVDDATDPSPVRLKIMSTGHVPGLSAQIENCVKSPPLTYNEAVYGMPA
jgi:hypothetical protein